MSLRVFAMAALVLSVAGAAKAGEFTSLSRAGFTASISGVPVEEQNFDSFADGTLLTGPQGGVTFSASQGSVVVTQQFFVTTDPNGIGSTATEADFGGLRFFTADNAVTIAFAHPIIAFAIDINAEATSAGAFRAALSNGDSVLSVFDAFPGLQTGQFIGFTANAPFTSLVISSLAGGTFTLDTVVFRLANPNVVPLPGAIFFVLTGAAALGAAARKRRAA